MNGTSDALVATHLGENFNQKTPKKKMVITQLEHEVHEWTFAEKKAFAIVTSEDIVEILQKQWYDAQCYQSWKGRKELAWAK